MKIEKEQRNRAGRWINPIAETKSRVYALRFIKRNFMLGNEFKLFTIGEYLDEKLDSWEKNDSKKINKEKQQIRRLTKSGWLKKPNKKNKKIDCLKKFKNYLKEFGSFDNPDGPLMKSKVVEKIKEIPIEKRIGFRDVYRGEV
ncbi:hypothetical protein ES703_24868 [subsurface metagenome]